MTFSAHFFVAALVSTLHISVLALPTTNTTASAEMGASDTVYCGNPRIILPFLRAYSLSAMDHFYTADAQEMQNAITHLGYKAEGTTGCIFSELQPSTVPLYRLYSRRAKDHFYTTDAQERDRAYTLGYKDEGTAGFVYPDNRWGTLPLYRSYNPARTDHFYIMSSQERDNAVRNGWRYEGVAAYIYPY